MRGSAPKGCVVAARGRGLALATVAACAAVFSSAASAATLSVVGSGQQALKIELDHGSNDKLVGQGHLVLRNDSEAPGTLHLEYLPQRGAEASDLKLAPITVSPHALATVNFDAELPAGSDPAELAGIASLRLESQGKAVGEPLDLTIEGAGQSFANVSIVPSAILLHNVNWAGFLHHAKSASISVELIGVGVPGLFHGGATQFTSHTLLRSSTGHELEATLTAAPPAGTDTLARGEVKVTGSLAPGSYSGTLPLSSVAAPGAPAVSVTTESGDSFLWAMLVVGLGALAGGGVYLASGLRRRKELMKQEVKEALERYRRVRHEWEARAGAPKLWTPSGLGEERKWFVHRWTSLPQLDGVQGVWSQIYWARNEGDLDKAQEPVETLVTRLRRWLVVADDGGPQLLQEALNLAPREGAQTVWRKTRTYLATAELLGRAAAQEPADDKAAEKLVEEVNRQARWHARLATLLDLKSQILADVGNREGSYEESDTETLKAIDPAAIDAKFAEVKGPDQQIALEVEVDGEVRVLRKMAEAKGLELRRIEGPDKAAALGAADFIDIAQQGIAPAVRPRVATAATDLIPGAAAQSSGEAPAEGSERTPVWLTGLRTQDVLWSALVVIVALAVYVPVLYGPTWGNLGDYAGAFIAGFVGKVAINWAALPAFRSLSARAKAPDLKEVAPDAAPADVDALKRLAGALDGAGPAAVAAPPAGGGNA
jgi:hypothetical protein